MPDEFESEVMATPAEEGAQGAEDFEDSPSSKQAEQADVGEVSGEEPDTAVKKPGVQQRIDELVREREDVKREREYWREMAMQERQKQQMPELPDTKTAQYTDLPMPSSDQYDTYDEFIMATAQWSQEVTERKFAERQYRQMYDGKKSTLHQRGAAKYSDWDVVSDPNVPISPPLGELIVDSEKGEDVAYFLAKNPHQAMRLSTMPIHKLGYEFAKIEQRVTQPSQKSKTNAPVPTSPVGGKEVPVKKLEDMSPDEYVAYMNRKDYGK